MREKTDNSSERRDWRISAILLAIWIIALVLVGGRENGIPFSMLALATVFFVLLIPAMNDLVRSLDRYAGGDSEDTGNSTKKPS